MSVNNIFSDKFTYHLKQALIKAHVLAVADTFRDSIDGIGTDNKAREVSVGLGSLLDALLFERGSIAAEILHKTKGPSHEETVDERLRAVENSAHAANHKVRLSDRAGIAVVNAVRISQEHGHKYVGTEHLLKSLSDAEDKEASDWWQNKKINQAELKKNLKVVLESTSKFPDLTAVFRREGRSREDLEDNKESALHYFGRELTDKEVQKDIDPVVGRGREIERVIHILSRRHKNNPVLLGDAGVGKTAIVEGLAKKILQGEVPPVLAGKKIFTIDLGSLVAGTIYRGEFEARFKNVIENAEHNGNTILFIDEMHTIMGAGSASGSLDAANMLKPALARGRISVIGATTMEEYKKHIETDSALERRFQSVSVNEPTPAETREVLAGVKKNYEEYHNVLITDAALDAAVALSSRYLTGKLQPDKSLDLIDEAAAQVKVERSQKSAWQKIRTLEKSIEDAVRAKQAAVKAENYAAAIEHKQREAELRQAASQCRLAASRDDENRTAVTREHVIRVVSALTRIPLGELKSDERETLKALQENLAKTVVGQDEALASVSSLIKRARTNVASPNKPLASLMFLGPTGVGKTSTAKELARTLFKDKDALIRIDMSEFSEGYAVSKLVGAPAGYVGYRDSNKFTDLVRRRPHSVVLFDEVEKAHPEIFNILLQVLEDGQLADATGRVVDFRNTIIIMTSNIGAEELNQAARLGFSGGESAVESFKALEEEMVKKTREHFRPEFLDRLDKLIVFKPLPETALRLIVNQYARELNERLKESGLSVSLPENVQEHIVKKAYSPQSGARGIRRFFQDNIESALAEAILDKGANISVLEAALDKDIVKFNEAKPVEAMLEQEKKIKF